MATAAATRGKRAKKGKEAISDDEDDIEDEPEDEPDEEDEDEPEDEDAQALQEEDRQRIEEEEHRQREEAGDAANGDGEEVESVLGD